MKTQAIALAALGALAGTASAQSSVTIFGTVDMSMRYVQNNDSTWQLAQDGMQGSRLGFRGVEDLGGGAKASFWLEGGIGPDTGTGGVSFGNGQPSTNAFNFRRRSTLSLSNQWGELRMGRDYTPLFWNFNVNDPFGNNGVGNAGNIFLSAEVRSLQGGSGAYAGLVRLDNTVGYILPNGQYGPGLYGQAQVSAGEGSAANKGFGGRIGYGAGPFDIAVAYGQTELDVAGLTKMQAWNLGGSWNLGMAKVTGYVGQIELSGLPNKKGNATQTNWFVGGIVPLGLANLRASYGNVSMDGNLVDGFGGWQFAIGADYNLSRRTALYATYSYIGNDNTAFSVSPTGSALSRGNNSYGAEVGIRHNF